jgi:hypothetical protein
VIRLARQHALQHCQGTSALLGRTEEEGPPRPCSLRPCWLLEYSPFRRSLPQEGLLRAPGRAATSCSDDNILAALATMSCEAGV